MVVSILDPMTIMTSSNALYPADQLLRHTDGGLYRYLGVATIVHPVDARTQPTPSMTADTPIGAALIAQAQHSEDRSTVIVLAGGGRPHWFAVVDASHADEQGDLVIYEHLWPFEPGTWARPLAEFAARFAPITQDVLDAAYRQDRASAQHAVQASKASRRGAAL